MKKQTNVEKLMQATAKSLAKIESQVKIIEQGKLESLKTKREELKAKLRELAKEALPAGEAGSFETPCGLVKLGKEPLVWQLKVPVSEFRKRFHNRLGEEVIDRCFKADITKVRGLFEGQPEEQDATLIEKQAGSRTISVKLN